jgi:uroporphyrinogen decarboxylase
MGGMDDRFTPGWAELGIGAPRAELVLGVPRDERMAGMKDRLTPRERVMTAVNHRVPDRVPLDFYAVPEELDALEKRLGLRAEPDANFPHTMAAHERLLETFHTDVRFVAPRYIGPPLPTFEDGSFMDVWGFRRTVTDYGAGKYYEFLDPRLAKTTTIAEVDAYPWPDPDWWDYSVIPLQCERYERYAIIAGDDGNVDFINRTSFHRGYEQVMLDLASRNEVLFRIWDHLSDFFYEHDRRILEAGRGRIDIMHFGDDYGSQRDTVISPQLYREIFQPRWRRHIEQAHAFDCKVMHHSCGSTRRLIPDLINTGIDVLVTVQPYAGGMDLHEIKQEYGHRLAFHGTLDIQQDLRVSTPAQVREIVRQRIEVMAPGGGFILAPTHIVQPDVPVENVIAAYEAALEYGWYDRSPQ